MLITGNEVSGLIVLHAISRAIEVELVVVSAIKTALIAALPIKTTT